MNVVGLIVLALFGGVVFLVYSSIANPVTAKRIEGPTAGEGGYYLTLSLFIGFCPLFLLGPFLTPSNQDVLGPVLAIWLGAWALWGLLGMFLRLPILKWFVPPAYRSSTEHVYPRKVIGLKRVDSLSNTRGGDPA